MSSTSSQQHLRTSSIPSSSSTIRPRTRRLVSGLDEDDPSPYSNISSAVNTAPTSPLASPFHSRAVSPIPSKHPSRSTSSQRVYRNPNASHSNSLLPWGGQSQNNQAASFAGLWNKSWTTLQSLASEALGSDVTDGDKKKATRTRRPFEATHGRAAGSSPPSKWGPPASPESRLGAGSREEREALVRAKKRQDLLAANGHAYAGDIGSIKRRTSDDRGSMSAPPADYEDRDALVYVHHVKKEDTLAGISIKYNCQIALITKANRMWPHDTVQSRKVILLPVDACGVKGKPLSGPHEDLLGGASNDESAIPTPTAPSNLPGSNHRRTQSSSTHTMNSDGPASSTATSEYNDEPPWKHDSWVTLEGQATATEIARLPRRALGYFPPARRKSVSYSDLDTPAVSIDLPRSPYVDSPPSQQRHSQQPSRRPSASYLAQHLQGPGGVGTFGKNVVVPGPAQDGLNKLFPNAAPREASELDLLTATNPLENVGGAIEGWVRKMATKAAAIVEPPARKPGKGAAGDLIELQSDPFEIGDDDSDCLMHAAGNADDDERGRTGIISRQRSRVNSPNGKIRPRSDDYREEGGKRKGE